MLTDAELSDSPPSYKGFYFALYPGCDKPEPLMLTDAGQFFVIGNDCPVDMKSIPYRGTRFMQLPTPEELEAMRTQIANLTQQRDAAEAELARLQEELSEIHKAWGIDE